jgi:predicted component of type VI protein secretion system
MDELTPSAESGWQLHGPHGEDEPALPAKFTPLRLVLQPSGLCVQLNTPSMLFGRHTDMDVRVALPDVSRRHCRFVFENGQWAVNDLNSLNGVYVNGARVADMVLKDGDEVRMGGLTFRVNIPDPQTTRFFADDAPPQRAMLKSIVDVLPPPIVREHKSKAA